MRRLMYFGVLLTAAACGDRGPTAPFIPDPGPRPPDHVDSAQAAPVRTSDAPLKALPNVAPSCARIGLCKAEHRG
jgi:hypothetical protein